MKRILRLVSLPLLCAALVSGALAADSGQVDFGKFNGPQKGEFVEIALGQGALKLASLFARCADGEAADLLANVSGVRVKVIGLDDSNRESVTTRVAAIRADLAQRGWEQIVTARGRGQEDVAIFLKHRDGEAIEGLVVTVIDERKHEAVLVNVVGNIRPEQLASVGESLKIRHLRVAKAKG